MSHDSKMDKTLPAAEQRIRETMREFELSEEEKDLIVEFVEVIAKSLAAYRARNEGDLS